MTRRQRGDTLFVINHTDSEVTVTVQGRPVPLGPYGAEVTHVR